MNKEEYIKTLTDQIRCKMARPEVARELEDHIEDQTRAFMSEGMSRQEAESAAVKDMGNPVDTGVEMDKIHRPKMPWGMIALIIVLSVTGCIFQYILNNRNIEAGGDGFLSQGRGWFTVLGIPVMIAVCFADYTRIAARARELMIGLIVLIVLGKQFLGPFSQREQAMDRLAGRMVCKYTAYTDADSPALCGDPVRIQGKGDGGYSEKCIVDDPGMLSGMAERQFMDDMCSLAYLSGCTCSGSLPRMVSVEKKAGARWDRGFCRGASVSGGVLLLVFRRGLSEGTAPLLSLSGCGMG